MSKGRNTENWFQTSGVFAVMALTMRFWSL